MTDRVSTYQGIRHSAQINNSADIQQSIEGRRSIFFTKVLDLSTAKDQYSPEKIEFNFRTFWVVSATDATAAVSMVPNTSSEGQLNGAIPLTQNLAIRLPNPTSGAQLYWSAQAGKTMTVLFFVDAEINPGSLISQISGGVVVSDGSALSSALLTGGVAKIACAASVATKILDTDTSRKVMNLYIDAPAWIGDASVSPGARGCLVPAGIIEIKSTALLYLYPVAGVVNVYGNDYR